MLAEELLTQYEGEKSEVKVVSKEESDYWETHELETVLKRLNLTPLGAKFKFPGEILAQQVDALSKLTWKVVMQVLVENAVFSNTNEEGNYIKLVEGMGRDANDFLNPNYWETYQKDTQGLTSSGEFTIINGDILRQVSPW